MQLTRNAAVSFHISNSNFGGSLPLASMIRSLVFATILAAVHAQGPTSSPTQPLACNDVPDVEAQCKLDCPDNLVDFDCGAYGVDCFCKNEKGEIENTNIDAPVTCGDSTIEEVCGAECNGITLVDTFKCKDDKADCTCAPDDGIPGLGDDVSQDVLEYVDEQNELAKLKEEELSQNPNPSPPVMAEDGTIIPAIADEVAMAPMETSSPPAASSAMGRVVGGSVLAVGAALMFA